MNDFYNLVDTIHKLESTTKTSEKIALLNSLKSVDIAKDFFEKALSPKYVFGINNFPDYDHPSEPYRDSMYHYVEVAYTRLLKDKTGIREFLEELKHSLTFYEYDLLTRICKKDPACGVSDALVNRVWEGLIDSGVKLCKAIPFSEKELKKIGFPCYVQKKEDGARCLCFLDTSGNYRFLSSSGKEYHKLEHIGEELRERITSHDTETINARLTHGLNSDMLILDGELLVTNGNNGYVPRKTGNGVLNKSIKNTISVSEARLIRFVIWDSITSDEYYNRIPKNQFRKYSERYGSISFLTNGLEYTKKVYGSLAYTPEEIRDAFREEIQAGNEGIIVKSKDFLWDNKRVPEQLKCKLELESTLEIVGFKYGQKGTKYENKLGAFICASSDRQILVSVGSGIDDTFRESYIREYEKNGYRIPGEPKFIEVRSNGIIVSQNATHSLFLPRMVMIRTDKTEADSYETILNNQNSIFEIKN